MFIHIYYFTWIVLDTHMPWVKVFKRFRACNFELVMNFGTFGQTTVDNSLWIVYETFRLVHIYGVLWSQCDVPSHHHVLYTWLWKEILVHDARIDRKWNPNINLICCMIISYFKPNWQCMVKNHMACDCAHPCPKFEVIWIMLGELMANK